LGFLLGSKTLTDNALVGAWEVGSEDEALLIPTARVLHVSAVLSAVVQWLLLKREIEADAWKPWIHPTQYCCRMYIIHSLTPEKARSRSRPKFKIGWKLELFEGSRVFSLKIQTSFEYWVRKL
jgi:hypothetical protein